MSIQDLPPIIRHPDPPARRPKRWRRRLILLLVIAAAAAVLFWNLRPAAVPENSVLVIDLRQEVGERSEAGLQHFLFGGAGVDMVALHRALERAAHDPRIAGLVLRVGAPGMGLGRAEEIRALAVRFRDRGKFVVSVLESPDTLGYFIATAGGEIWLERGGILHLVGLEMQAYFLGGAFSRLGLHADMVRVGEYKGAYEQLVGSEPTPEFREAMAANLDSLYETLMTVIAAARRISTAQAEALIDKGPFTPEAALDAGLVDKLVYRDQLAELLADRCNKKEPKEITVVDYLARSSSPGDARIALVHVSGMLVDRGGPALPLLGPLAGADELREALRSAREDRSIMAVVVRVDSPGGTLSAAEAVWREIDLTRDLKPVVVSMGDMAASGGYFIAAAADRIFAQSGTLTGSIGIFGGKISAAGLLDEYKVRVETASRGAHAGLYSLHRDFTEEEREAMNEILKDGYRLFVRRVADGRKKTYEEAERLARGRVWTGREALQIGLIDGLGGLDAALAEARQRAGLDPEARGEPRLFPPEKGILDLLAGAAGESRYLGVPAPVEGARWPLGPAADLAAALRRLGILDGRGRLALLPVALRVR